MLFSSHLGDFPHPGCLKSEGPFFICRCFDCRDSCCVLIIIIIIIIISVFKEDNVFSITASLPYGPPVNTDIDYYRNLSDLLIFVSLAKLVVRYVFGEEKPVLAL